MIKVFESERIDFVRVDPNLINDYLKMVNDKEIQSFIGLSNITVSFDDEMNWIKEKMEEGSNTFSMIEKSTNEYIGNIEIMEIKDKKGELGICITNEKCDKHYGTEAINRFLDYAYNDLNLDEVYLNVHGDNKRAIKCYENCNFIIDAPGRHEGDYHMIHQKEKNND